MNTEEKLKLCRGCREDFYNGHNELGVKRCWNLASAEPVERVCVGTWDSPPYLRRVETTLSCHRPKGLTWLSPNDVRVLSAEDFKRVTSSREAREAWQRS